VRRHRVEEAVDALARTEIGLADALDLEHQLLDAHLRDCAQQVQLGREVVEERLLRDVGAVADLGDPGLLEPLLGEELARRLQDPRPHLELPALPARKLGRGFRRSPGELRGLCANHGAGV
jgi:hypothetical protein